MSSAADLVDQLLYASPSHYVPCMNAFAGKNFEDTYHAGKLSDFLAKNNRFFMAGSGPLNSRTIMLNRYYKPPAAPVERSPESTPADDARRQACLAGTQPVIDLYALQLTPHLAGSLMFLWNMNVAVEYEKLSCRVRADINMHSINFSKQECGYTGCMHLSLVSSDQAYPEAGHMLYISTRPQSGTLQHCQNSFLRHPASSHPY